jgi:hypothetical protein
MAEVVLFDITEEIINRLCSLTAQEVAPWWRAQGSINYRSSTTPSPGLRL